MPRRRLFAVLALLAACSTPQPAATPPANPVDDAHARLPTGVHLDPVAPLHVVGQMPLAMMDAPEGDRVVLLVNGWRDEGIQVVDRGSGRVLQSLPLPAVFLGLQFSPDGRSLYVSGGNGDVVYRLDWSAGAATLRDSLVLQAKPRPNVNGSRYPAGLALSRDGRTMYVAENLADSLAVVDLASGQVVQRIATGHYPYAVVVAPDGSVYVSDWGGWDLSTFAAAGDGRLRATGTIRVGRHPSALLLNPRGNRIFVATASTDRVVSVDPARRRVIGELLDPPPSGPGEGSTPNALALSGDGLRLYVAEADANAVAVFDLSAMTSGVAGANGDDLLAGRIPAGWYPTSLLARGDTLVVASGKGGGTFPNPDGPQPVPERQHLGPRGVNRTLSQLNGGLLIAPVARAGGEALARYTARVAQANGWTTPRTAARGYPPFEHVVYIVKENRTYDQVLGDLPQADGDTSLVLFGRDVTPNQHALAERFGIYDRFFVNAEVSPDGHNWSMAAYTTDYLQKTVPLNYSGRGRSYEYEGANFGARTVVPNDDPAAPARGYLWDLIQRKGLTFRNYGEFVIPERADPDDVLPPGYRGNKPFLASHTNPAYPGFDLNITDQHRADVWLAELAEFTKRGVMPAFEIIRLPNDHTAGARAGAPTPQAYAADNDLALGRMIEGLSRSPFWKSTVVFVVEDDAQNGPDHVDSHRSPVQIISPYSRAGVVHRFANTTDVIRTMEEILGLDALSQFDYHGRPLRDIWSATPDLTPWTVLRPNVDLNAKNPANTRGASESAQLDLEIEDVAAEDPFNRIIWEAVKPGVAYPGARRGATLEAVRR
ncbi:MAG TPA: bifunctional YncE family protein/alkaline phosphatase family protein [Gemmatimonadaceae bacterium]|nr:bifunctional YncE family protein/alkaline phosphatase family protein [Gemmatimonadaceae bacterium]